MATGKEIRIKIQSIRNTQKITKAMEMVAASKMRKAQDRMEKTKPFSKKIMEVIAHVAASHAEYQHPFMEKRALSRVGYIIITSDRGLCGGLNNNLLKATVSHIKSHLDQNIEVDLCLLGNKGMVFFKRIGGNIVAHQRDLGDAPRLSDLIGSVKVMLDAYSEKKIDALYLASNEFINTMVQKPDIQKILPIEPLDQTEQHYWDYLYEPDDAKLLLGKLIKRYLESQVYRSVIENVACEQASRMIAMKSATDNAADLISQLQLVYNKARQAAITRELSEIVAGAAVLGE